MDTKKLPNRSTSTVKVWHPEGFVGLEFKQGATESKPSAPHLHEAYQISLITAGATIFRYRRSQQIAPANSLMAIAPGEVHENVSVGARTFFNLYAEPQFFQQLGLFEQPEQVPYLREAVICDPTSLTLFTAIFKSDHESNTLIERETYLMKAFTYLFERYTNQHLANNKNGQEHRAVAIVKDFIHEQYAADITLSELSVLTGLHKNYVLNVFTAEVGISPHRYLINIRISQAKRLIKQEVPIAQVAAMTGFSDQSHLTREFRKHSLITPSAYQHNR